MKNRHPQNRLDAASLLDLRPSLRPFKVYDGGGLYILVNPDGSMRWRFKYRFSGKERLLSCGTFPTVALEDARARRDAFRELLRDGVDPGNYVKEEKAAQQEADTRRFSGARFFVDNEGALIIHMGTRRITLTPAETDTLRTFLDATRTLKGR